MFDANLKPVGLYVEKGRELVHANVKSGRGNFHMKPNGIFYISAHGAAVVETQAFLEQRPRADLATQSGPMLVIDGLSLRSVCLEAGHCRDQSSPARTARSASSS